MAEDIVCPAGEEELFAGKVVVNCLSLRAVAVLRAGGEACCSHPPNARANISKEVVGLAMQAK